MNIISIRENPEYSEKAIQYIQEKWANDNSLMVYEDCIKNSIKTSNPLPQWFSSLYIEKGFRGQALGSLLINKAKEDAKDGGFSYLYLCTDHIGYYEKNSFTFIGNGYHPWGDNSRIYVTKL